MAARWSTDRLIQEIAVLGSRGLSRREYFAELAPRLRRSIDSDATCWHTLDPHTRLLTSDAPDELVAAGIFTEETVATAGELVVRSEYLVDDANGFADLARRRTPVGILDHETGGDPERSARYRDVLEPAGIPHELRGAFVARGRTWGAVHIARRTSSAPFTKDDAAVLARVAGTIASGIRASLRFDAARRGDGAEPPGLVVLGPRDEVELVTPPARELLDAMRPRVGFIRARAVGHRRPRVRSPVGEPVDGGVGVARQTEHVTASSHIAPTPRFRVTRCATSSAGRPRARCSPPAPASRWVLCLSTPPTTTRTGSRRSSGPSWPSLSPCSRPTAAATSPMSCSSSTARAPTSPWGRSRRSRARRSSAPRRAQPSRA